MRGVSATVGDTSIQAKNHLKIVRRSGTVSKGEEEIYIDDG